MQYIPNQKSFRKTHSSVEQLIALCSERSKSFTRSSTEMHGDHSWYFYVYRNLSGSNSMSVYLVYMNLNPFQWCQQHEQWAIAILFRNHFSITKHLRCILIIIATLTVQIPVDAQCTFWWTKVSLLGTCLNMLKKDMVLVNCFAITMITKLTCRK